MKQEKMSVIIPVFNGEKYLKDCLDSIRKQTYSQLQIIVVNDGSTDNTPMICEHYASMDKRIQVINKENAGLVAARKTGVDCAEGEYIGFVDADDWIDSDMYESLLTVMEMYQCDLAASGTYRQFGEEYSIDKNTISARVYSRRALEQEVLPYMLYNGKYFQMGVRPNVVNKIFRKNLLKSILNKVPDKITNGEDVAITYTYLLQSQTVCLTDNVYYHYRQHRGSMSQSHTNLDTNEITGIRLLYSYLYSEFVKDNFSAKLLEQLDFYISHLLIQRYSWIYDNDNLLFRIFGGVKADCKIGIYGAGKFGKQIFNHAKKMDMDFVWVDKNDNFYRSQGYSVKPVIALSQEKCDIILIAVIDQKTALQIENQLKDLGISEDIRRLDIRYITSRSVLNRLGFGRE